MQIPTPVIADFLSKLDLLQDLDDADIQRLLPHLDILRADPDQGVFAEGTHGAALYIVLEGEISIERGMPNGPPHQLATLLPGECFGEMSLLDGAPRMATARSTSRSLLARLSRAAFDAMLEREPDLGVALLRSMSRVLCQRQRELTVVLQDMVDFERAPHSPEEEALNRAVLRHVTWN